MTCYNCNGEGHISRDCPQGGSGGRGRGGRGGGKCRDFFLQFFFSDIFLIFFLSFFQNSSNNQLIPSIFAGRGRGRGTPRGGGNRMSIDTGSSGTGSNKKMSFDD